MNKLCYKNERVLFSRYQYTANVPVLSDIAVGERAGLHIIVLKYCSCVLNRFFFNNKSLNQKTRLSSYGCHQCFAPISFVVDISISKILS